MASASKQSTILVDRFDIVGAFSTQDNVVLQAQTTNGAQVFSVGSPKAQETAPPTPNVSKKKPSADVSTQIAMHHTINVGSNCMDLCIQMKCMRK